jgi:hypothetical protein
VFSIFLGIDNQFMREASATRSASAVIRRASDGPIVTGEVVDFHEPFLHEGRKLEYLLQELDSAMTFLDIADASAVQQVAQRNQRHAREAYESALGILAAVTPSAERQKAIEDKLTVVRERLGTRSRGGVL